MPKFGIKNALFRCFRARISKKNFVIFEMNSLESASLHKFAEQRKCLNLGPKLTYLGILVRAF